MSDLISKTKVLECIGNAINGIVNMPTTHDKRTETHSCDNERTETHGDLISRKAAINAVCSVCGDTECNIFDPDNKAKLYCPEPYAITKLPPAEPERVWHPVENPPAHHKDVIVRGVEAIGNVTVHKVMQWDVDTWRPTNYAPSITWTEWSEI